MSYFDEKLSDLGKKIATRFINNRVSKIAQTLKERCSLENLPQYSILLIELCDILLGKWELKSIANNGVLENTTKKQTEFISSSSNHSNNNEEEEEMLNATHVNGYKCNSSLLDVSQNIYNNTLSFLGMKCLGQLCETENRLMQNIVYTHLRNFPPYFCGIYQWDFNAGLSYEPNILFKLMCSLDSIEVKHIILKRWIGNPTIKGKKNFINMAEKCYQLETLEVSGSPHTLKDTSLQGMVNEIASKCKRLYQVVCTHAFALSNNEKLAEYQGKDALKGFIRRINTLKIKYSCNGFMILKRSNDFNIICEISRAE